MRATSSPVPLDVARVFALAAAAALARALLAEAADGFAAHGRISLALSAASTRFLEGLVLAFGALLALRIWHRAVPRAWLPASICAVLAYAFLALRVPAMPIEAPGWSGPKAIAAHAVAILGAGAIAWLLVRPQGLPKRLDRVLVRGALLLAALAIVSKAVDRFALRATPERPNVILISLDGVRGDRLGCAGYARPTTPCLDLFARRAVRFENAYSPSPSTLAAHATLLTGLLPNEHDVGPAKGLPAQAPALAAELGAQGFETFALVDDTPWLDQRFGLARGFGWWRRCTGDADAKLAALEPVLDVIEGRRAFVFLHFADANADTLRSPYNAEPEDRLVCVPPYTGSWRGCDEQGRCGAQCLLAQSVEAGVPPDREVIEQVSALYDAGLRGLDRRMGRLFEDLERRGLLENSLVIVTSDHGEAFFEHGRFLHLDGWRECTHVPLIVRPPGGAEERSVEPAVSIADVAPTVLDLVGVSGGARPTAVSLADCVRGGPALAMRGLAHLDMGSQGRGIRSASAALLEITGRMQLYDLDFDPLEQHPLAADGDPRAAALAAGLLGPLAPPYGPGVPVEPFDDVLRGRVEWLGEPVTWPMARR